MDKKQDKITLYTSQRIKVLDLIEKEGVYFVKTKYIRQKYGEVAHLFMAAYEWYMNHAVEYVPAPAEAESAVWAFRDPIDVPLYEGCKILTLEVPIEEAVFFDMMEWSEILNFRYLGSAEERRMFAAKQRYQGIKEPMQIVVTAFYPLLKRELQSSWKSLFRYDRDIKNGESVPVGHIQAGLWQIKKEWITSVE